ncbi:MAG: CHAT domain-containing protein [bacterium]|nr:CHAT domain-containing protein [bacterium]
MKDYADLEIGLHCLDQYYWNTGQYQIQLRFNRPDNEVDEWYNVDGIRFDKDSLRKLALDNDEYGKVLGENLFGIQEVWDFFEKARVVAQAKKVPLRVRLFIGQSAPELHNLHWETLRDPQNGNLLLTDGQLLFSRYLSSSNWRSLRLRPKQDNSELRALIVIANPTDLAAYQLPSLNVDEELKRARESLGKISVKELTSKTESASGPASLQNMLTHLRDGYDILYLICHGKFHENNPWLLLETEDGSTHRVAGNEFVSRIRDLPQQPRLIVLASCQSAGTGDDSHTEDGGVLAALGPRLADANIPAVIAMQGNITIKTVNEFMPVFFKELMKDGQIDLAMTVARSAVLNRHDWWVPALFMRLKSGRIWYTPGFGELKQWPGLISSIDNEKHRCTAILGPGLSEPLVGSRRELARRWAAKYHYPMSPHYQEELPHVAQYLSIDQGFSFPQESLLKYVKEDLLKRHKKDLDDVPDSSQTLELDQLLRIIGQKQRQRNPMDPYKVLAELPFHIYINANPGNLLVEALRENGKEPKVEICQWNPDIASPFVWAEEPDYQPTAKTPLVYYLFGRLTEPDSLVLTEDDYFEYLIQTSKDDELIPEGIAAVLADSALLFLGFQMDAWDFRVLFRSIVTEQEGKRRRKHYTHVAAQITPEEGSVLDTDDARRYIEKYFKDISIYWGSTEDFVQELKTLWDKRGAI